MKSNLFKYIFIIFFIGIMIFAIYKIKTDEGNKEQAQAQITENQKERIKEINLGIAEYDTLNPIVSKNKNVQDIQKLIYEPLINLSTDYKLEQALATEWVKKTDTTYIIKLREGVKWPDETYFTAEDVRFTIDKLKETASIYSYNVEQVEKVEVVDEQTLTITLSNEVPFFEYNLTFPIVQASTYSNDAIPTGTGKYIMTEETPEHIVLGKNQNWWGAKEKNLILEKITINKYATLGELYNGFKIGNTDVISTDNANLQDYIGKIGYNEKKLQGREHTFLALNTQRNLLSSVAVRKAISYSIDKENIVSSIFNNQNYASSFPLEYGTWIYQSQNSSAGYNPDQGKEELQNDGWSLRNKIWQKGGTKTTNTRNSRNNRNSSTGQRLEINLLVKASDATKVSVAQNIQGQLAAQGITVNITQASDEQYQTNLNNKNFDMALSSVYISPNPSMELFFGEGNLANYSNDEVKEKIKEVKNTTDENVLKADYQRLGEIYKTEVPYISLYTNQYNVLYNASLQGEFAPNWFSSFYGVETWCK